MLVRGMTTTLFYSCSSVRGGPGDAERLQVQEKSSLLLHVTDPMLVTGVLTTGDRYHSKVSDLQDFAVV